MFYGKNMNMISRRRWAACACFLPTALFCTGCSQPAEKTAPASSPALSSTGAITITAKVSGGTRFVAYSNDVWAKPVVLPLVVNQLHDYRFEVPAKVTSFRFDPSELPGVTAEIRHIRVELPGQPPRALPLEDLPRWLTYHCAVTYEDGNKMALIKSNARDMYVMSTVDVSSMPHE